MSTSTPVVFIHGLRMHSGSRQHGSTAHRIVGDRTMR
jgi:hypothetical protein